MTAITIFLQQFKAYFIAAAIIITLIAFLLYRHSLIVDGEQKLESKVQATTIAAEQRRKADLAKQAKVDAAIVQGIEETHALQLHAALAATDDINARLRAYTAARSRGLAAAGDPATSAGPDDATGQPGGVADPVERAQEGVNTAAAKDASKVIGLQNYITKECHNAASPSR